MRLRSGWLGFLCGLTLLTNGCNDAIDAAADTVDAGFADSSSATDTVVEIAPSDIGNCCAAHGAVCGTPKACPGLVCGACPTGATCGGDNQCHSNIGPSLRQFGEPCGPNQDCPLPANTSDAAAMQAYATCTGNQCEGGVCNLGACTRRCVIGVDVKDNASGAGGADGIEDSNGNSACSGAVNGPWGTQFSCVQVAAPQGSNTANETYCLPESDFKPCQSAADCTAGDACLVQLIYGQYRSMCGPALKTPIGTPGAYTYTPGARLGEACNGDLNKGGLALCADSFCAGDGFCTALCKTDNDCVSHVGACGGGKCAGGKSCASDADCSAYRCKAAVPLYTSPAFTASLCLPKDCAADGDCGAGAFCRPFWNGVKKAGGEPDPNAPGKSIYPAFQTMCQTIATSAVKPGATCDPYVASANATKPGAACQNPYACREGNCGSLCQGNSDCAVDQLCGVETFAFDLDNASGSGVSDGVPEFELALDVCAYLPQASGPCTGQSDCSGSSSYCKAFVHKLELPKDATPIGSSTLNGVCVAMDGKAAQDGEACGAIANDAYCASGFCLNTLAKDGTQQAGYCADVCSGKNDCPSTIVNGGATYRNYCRSLHLSFNGTVDDVRDDLYLPYCQPTAMTNTLEDCSATKTCKTGGEQCQPMAIASGPDTPVKVEFVCTNVGATATKGVGAACTLNTSGGGSECASGLGCWPDAGGKGYCSALCSKNADCAVGGDKSLVCDLTHQWVPRVAASQTVIVPICKKAKACVPCVIDNDCAGAYACSQLGNSGRCAPICASNADCAGKDGGGSCVDALGLNGAATGKKVCAPATCP